jgi:hypothetical protein
MSTEFTGIRLGTISGYMNRTANSWETSQDFIDRLCDDIHEDPAAADILKLMNKVQDMGKLGTLSRLDGEPELTMQDFKNLANLHSTLGFGSFLNEITPNDVNAL